MGENGLLSPHRQPPRPANDHDGVDIGQNQVIGLARQISSGSPKDLTEAYAAGGTTGLVDAIADHLQKGPQGRLLYLLEDSAAHRLAGNLGRWPAVSSADGWVHGNSS